jgi:hypothetical protein
MCIAKEKVYDAPVHIAELALCIREVYDHERGGAEVLACLPAAFDLPGAGRGAGFAGFGVEGAADGISRGELRLGEG